MLLIALVFKENILKNFMDELEELLIDVNIFLKR
jgi:hypothetical protein